DLFPAKQQELEAIKKEIKAQEQKIHDIAIAEEKRFFQKRTSAQQDASEFLFPLLDHLADIDIKKEKRSDEKYQTTTGTVYKTPVARIFTLVHGSRTTVTDPRFKNISNLTSEAARAIQLSLVKPGNYLY